MAAKLIGEVFMVPAPDPNSAGSFDLRALSYPQVDFSTILSMPLSASALIARLTEISRSGLATAELVEQSRCALAAAIQGGLELPSSFFEPHPEHYARRLLHRDPVGAFTCVVMVWGVGQGTPLHDHNRMWCVEGVLQGEIVVEQYNLLGNDGDLYSFDNCGSISALKGSAGSLIPPYEYHLIRNPAEKPAVTLHIYGGEMNRATVFMPTQDRRYLRAERTLSYTS